MYLNNNYIDVFKYFLNTFLYYFQNIFLIHLFHYKYENERNIKHKISSIIQYVNNNIATVVASATAVAVNGD